MNPGRGIGGDEHDARALAQQIVEDARAEAERLRDAARAEIAQTRHDAEKLAGRIVHDARLEAERVLAQAGAPGRIRRDTATAAGAIDEVVGGVLRAAVAGAALGDVVEIERRGGPPLLAEVVGFRAEHAVLLPLGEVTGVAPASRVWRTAAPLAIRCGEDLLGRVLDALGATLDGGPDVNV